jgi:peptide-methionine (S)-S-oxide reductase
MVMFTRRASLVACLAPLLGLSACERSAAKDAVAPPLPDPAVDAPRTPGGAAQSAVFAGGCFWGVQAVFQHVNGVLKATSGYAGGDAKDAHYETVSTGRTGHAESVKVVYDPARVSYGQLLKVFMSVAHDPTQLDHQGPDWGPQYRSAIFYASDEQRRIAQAYIAQLQAAHAFAQPVVTRLAPLQGFYEAEAYHQDYLHKHPGEPYIVINDLPKLAQLKAMFPALYREERS